MGKALAKSVDCMRDYTGINLSLRDLITQHTYTHTHIQRRKEEEKTLQLCMKSLLFLSTIKMWEMFLWEDEIFLFGYFRVFFFRKKFNELENNLNVDSVEWWLIYFNVQCND